MNKSDFSCQKVIKIHQSEEQFHESGKKNCCGNLIYTFYTDVPSHALVASSWLTQDGRWILSSQVKQQTLFFSSSSSFFLLSASSCLSLELKRRIIFLEIPPEPPPGAEALNGGQREEVVERDRRGGGWLSAGEEDSAPTLIQLQSVLLWLRVAEVQLFCRDVLTCLERSRRSLGYS